MHLTNLSHSNISVLDKFTQEFSIPSSNNDGNETKKIQVVRDNYISPFLFSQ